MMLHHVGHGDERVGEVARTHATVHRGGYKDVGLTHCTLPWSVLTISIASAKPLV
jgi:hypothetical protein